RQSSVRAPRPPPRARSIMPGCVVMNPFLASETVDIRAVMSVLPPSCPVTRIPEDVTGNRWTGSLLRRGGVVVGPGQVGEDQDQARHLRARADLDQDASRALISALERADALGQDAEGRCEQHQPRDRRAVAAMLD